MGVDLVGGWELILWELISWEDTVGLVVSILIEELAGNFTSHVITGDGET